MTYLKCLKDIFSIAICWIDNSAVFAQHCPLVPKNFSDEQMKHSYILYLNTSDIKKIKKNREISVTFPKNLMLDFK